MLIKSNEGDINYFPGNSRTVCWGGNSEDLYNYLGYSYDDYAVQGDALSQEDCDIMFALKLADARASADKIFGGSDKPECPCARAAAVDVIYDVSPAIAEVALQGWKVPMDANLYEIPDESDITEDAVEWLYAYQWCMFNNTRCGNDQQ